MTGTCPACGYHPPLGRPRKIDYKILPKLLEQDLPYRTIARRFKVSRTAVSMAVKKLKLKTKKK